MFILRMTGRPLDFIGSSAFNRKYNSSKSNSNNRYRFNNKENRKGKIC